MRLFQLDDGTQRGAIQHVDHVAAVRNLHGRGIGIAINGDHFNAQALQFDDDFFTQLAAATQQYAGRGRRQWSSDTGHFRSSRKQIIEGACNARACREERPAFYMIQRVRL